MKQYCKYCAYCVDGDAYYCTLKDIVLSESKVKRTNCCADYQYSVLGDVDSGKQYTPRKQRSITDGKEAFEQLTLF